MSWRASAGRTAAPLALLLLGAALAVAALAASSSGAVRIPLGELPALLWGQPVPGNELWRNVLIDIRLPRVLFALVAGAALAVSGASMQALFRNPLAEPGLIGISAGGALGAVGAIVLTSGGFWILAPRLSPAACWPPFAPTPWAAGCPGWRGCCWRASRSTRWRAP